MPGAVSPPCICRAPRLAGGRGFRVAAAATTALCRLRSGALKRSRPLPQPFAHTKGPRRPAPAARGVPTSPVLTVFWPT
jgi:hypothetical protein